MVIEQTNKPPREGNYAAINAVNCTTGLMVPLKNPVISCGFVFGALEHLEVLLWNKSGRNHCIKKKIKEPFRIFLQNRNKTYVIQLVTYIVT